MRWAAIKRVLACASLTRADACKMSHTLTAPIRTNATPSQRLAVLLSMSNLSIQPGGCHSWIEPWNCASALLTISPNTLFPLLRLGEAGRQTVRLRRVKMQPGGQTIGLRRLPVRAKVGRPETTMVCLTK